MEKRQKREKNEFFNSCILNDLNSLLPFNVLRYILCFHVWIESNQYRKNNRFGLHFSHSSNGYKLIKRTFLIPQYDDTVYKEISIPSLISFCFGYFKDDITRTPFFLFQHIGLTLIFSGVSGKRIPLRDYIPKALLSLKVLFLDENFSKNGERVMIDFSNLPRSVTKLKVETIDEKVIDDICTNKSLKYLVIRQVDKTLNDFSDKQSFRSNTTFRNFSKSVKNLAKLNQLQTIDLSGKGIDFNCLLENLPSVQNYFFRPNVFPSIKLSNKEYPNVKKLFFLHEKKWEFDSNNLLLEDSTFLDFRKIFPNLTHVVLSRCRRNLGKVSFLFVFKVLVSGNKKLKSLTLYCKKGGMNEICEDYVASFDSNNVLEKLVIGCDEIDHFKEMLAVVISEKLLCLKTLESMKYCDWKASLKMWERIFANKSIENILIPIQSEIILKFYKLLVKYSKDGRLDHLCSFNFLKPGFREMFWVGEPEKINIKYYGEIICELLKLPNLKSIRISPELKYNDLKIIFENRSSFEKTFKKIELSGKNKPIQFRFFQAIFDIDTLVVEDDFEREKKYHREFKKNYELNKDLDIPKFSSVQNIFVVDLKEGKVDKWLQKSVSRWKLLPPYDVKRINWEMYYQERCYFEKLSWENVLKKEEYYDMNDISFGELKKNLLNQINFDFISENKELLKNSIYIYREHLFSRGRGTKVRVYSIYGNGLYVNCVCHLSFKMRSLIPNEHWEGIYISTRTSKKFLKEMPSFSSVCKKFNGIYTVGGCSASSGLFIDERSVCEPLLIQHIIDRLFQCPFKLDQKRVRKEINHVSVLKFICSVVGYGLEIHEGYDNYGCPDYDVPSFLVDLYKFRYCLSLQERKKYDFKKMMLLIGLNDEQVHRYQCSESTFGMFNEARKDNFVGNVENFISSWSRL